jgi:hypothetical protein
VPSLAGGEYHVLRQSEMYDVGVRPSYDRSGSSIFALRPEWCSAEQDPCGGR